MKEEQMRVLGEEENFLAIPEKVSSYNGSEIVILQAPLEKTVSYGKGTANGPQEIINASHFVEFFDEELGKQLCFDKGICTLESLSFKGMTAEKAIASIYSNVRNLLLDKKYVVTLGGEHSLSIAPVKAHYEMFENLSILQIDAHSDLRDEYEGSKSSHASVMARVSELSKRIVQVGIRAQCKEEYDFRVTNNIKSYYARGIRRNEYGANWMNSVVNDLGQNVYLTFDVDGLDPSVIPATGTPEPGGLWWDEALDLIRLVASKRKIVGFDVVELAPKKNESYSNFMTAKLVYKILNYVYYAGKA